MIETKTRYVVVGATGVVGREALGILAERGVPASNIRAIGSSRSEGTSVPYGAGGLTVEGLTPDSFGGVDIALFCASAKVAREHAPIAAKAGATVIDNSSEFRADPAVPLVVPEINGELLDGPDPPRHVANPNCSTIILLVAVEPIRRAFGLERVIVSTYQAVSGAGASGLEALRRETDAIARGEAPEAGFFPVPCAHNVFPHESPLDKSTGRNGEEAKIIAESRRIWGDSGARVTPTCVRVPVERVHAQSITVDTSKDIDEDALRAMYREAPGVEFCDAPGGAYDPRLTPLSTAGTDPVRVGRLRFEPGVPRSVSLWACGDQLRKGAALNAVQIAERVMRHADPSVCR